MTSPAVAAAIDALTDHADGLDPGSIQAHARTLADHIARVDRAFAEIDGLIAQLDRHEAAAAACTCDRPAP